MYFIGTSVRSFGLSDHLFASVSKLATRLRHPSEGSASWSPGAGIQKMKISYAGTEIHALLDECVAAHAAGDPDRLFTCNTRGVVSYPLPPPLQQGTDTPYG